MQNEQSSFSHIERKRMLSLHENSIRKLRIFVTVVESGGFSTAQTELGLSAATISIQMKELEANLGMVLCLRGRSGFRLTAQGQAVYEAAKDVLSAFGNFNLEAAAIQNRLAGEIKIGLQANMATNPELKLAQAINQFHQRENQVLFKFEEARSVDQQSRTLEGRYDLCIGLYPNHAPGLDYTPLFRETVNLYCSADHPLCSVRDADEFTKHLGQTAMVSSGGALEHSLEKPPGLPEATAFTEDMDAAMLLVLSGRYIAFLPTHFAQFWCDRQMVRPILPAQFSSDCQFELITRHGGRDNVIVDVFIADLLHSHQASTPKQ